MVVLDLAPSKLDPDLNLGIEESNKTYFFFSDLQRGKLLGENLL